MSDLGCGTNDNILYATALLCLAVLIAAGYVVCRVVKR